MAKLNPVKQGFNALEVSEGITAKWMNKNTVRFTKDGTTSGCDIKLEKFEDSTEYLVSKREHSQKIWLAIAVMREDGQDPLDFKHWMTRVMRDVKNGELN